MVGFPNLLVLADDLTGANDAGVQFAQSGIGSIVLREWTCRQLPSVYPVVVVNTESRHVSAFEAARRVNAVARLGVQAGIRWFFKKTDSTLRGNIGAELEALLEATAEQRIAFVPALPDLGRTTRGGIHYVHGTPIAETSFSRDPLNPIRQSRVADVLNLKGSICSLRDPASQWDGVAVLDCESNDDFAEIADTLASQNALRVLSGSVGLLRYLVKHLEIPSNPPERPRPNLPMLLVNGSVHEQALEQIARGAAHFSKVQLTREHLLLGRAHLTIPSGGGNLLLHSLSHACDLEEYRAFAISHGISENDLHLRVAERTGEIVRHILAAGVFRTVIVFGGDTLAGIARANGWAAFEPLGEMEPGVSMATPAGTSLSLISKAGGFGDAEVLNRIVRFVVAHQKESQFRQN